MLKFLLQCINCSLPCYDYARSLCKICEDSLLPSPQLCAECGSPVCPINPAPYCTRPWVSKINLRQGQIDAYSARYHMIGQGYSVLKKWKLHRGSIFDQQVLNSDQNLLEAWKNSEASVIVPIPQHFFRAWQMRGSPVERIANWVGSITQLPLLKALDIGHLNQSNKRQAQRTLGERLDNKRNRFILNKTQKPVPKNIILIDDFMTSGRTFNEAAQILRNAGVQRIHAFCLGVRVFHSLAPSQKISGQNKIESDIILTEAEKMIPKFNQLRSNIRSGFSLIEVTIALAIGSLGMYALTATMMNANKAQKTANLTSEFQTLITEARLAVNDSLNCLVTFTDSSYLYQFDTLLTTPPNLPIPKGQGLYLARKGNGPSGVERARAVLTVHEPDTNQVIANYNGLQITKLQIQDWSGVAPVYYANLFIQVQKYPIGGSVTALGARLLEKKIPFQIVTDIAGRITACGSINTPLPIPTSDALPSDGTTNAQDNSILTKQLTPEEEAQVRTILLEAMKNQVNQ